MRYLNLDIAIGAGAGPDYALTVQAPKGQAHTSFRFPFSQTELQAHLKDLQIALLRSSGEHRGALSPEERAVQHFGQTLFESLLTGEVGSLYTQTQRLAADQETPTGVRVRLAIAPAHLAIVPWEYLCDPADGSYPCLLPDTSLVRTLDIQRPVPPLRVALPLRVLGMIASPSDQDHLNVVEEQDRLRRAFAPLQESGQMELHWVDGQTWEALQDALFYHGPWHIFHFIGHGGVHPQSGDGVLAFVNERGTTHVLNADDLATLLAGRRLRLVVLNACEGARGNDHDVFSSTAATLARRGIPGVLAMQYPISDKAAVQLTTKLYSALARGIPLDEAVVAARQAIRLSRSKTLEWGTPVLYLRAQEGILFELQAGAGASSPVQAPIQTTPIQMPNSADWLAQAQTHYQARRYEDALTACEQALKLDPNAFEASRGKALTLLALARFEEALPLLERLSVRVPTDDSIARLRDRTRQEAARQTLARGRLGSPFLTYRGHTDYVYAVAWAPDGRRLASGGLDHTVQVWDIATATHLVTYSGHDERVHAVAWAPDGKRLASGSWDKTVQVWDVATAQRLVTYWHTGYVDGVAWAPDGRRLASSGLDQTVQVWDAATAQCLVTYSGHASSVNAVAWASDGRRIASCSWDATVQVWDAVRGKRLITYSGHGSNVVAVAWAPDGRCIASGGGAANPSERGDTTVQVWDAAKGKRLITYSGHGSVVVAVAWAPDGRCIASSDGVGVHVWDAATAQRLITYSDSDRRVLSIAWAPDSRHIASGNADGTVQVWVVSG